MKRLNKKVLFSFLAASFLLCGNSFASEELSVIDPGNYSYINNEILGTQQSGYDVDTLNKLSVNANYNTKDISDYISMSVKERQMEKMQNKVAVSNNDLVYEPINDTMSTWNAWARPYASIEKVRTGNGRFDVQTYGIYTGMNSGLIELGHGWDAVMGGYLGYTGAHIDNDIVSTYQNGGTIGFETMFFKDRFFTGFDISTGAMAGKVNFNDIAWITLCYINAGISNKTGYNIELADGKFIIQPNLVTAYSFAHEFDRHKSSMDVPTVTMNYGLIEPGINFIYKFDSGWQPYAGFSVAWNITDNEKMIFTFAGMPDVAARCFFKYGLGVRKNFGDRVGINFQAFARNGGRTGVGFQGGLNVALGK